MDFLNRCLRSRKSFLSEGLPGFRCFWKALSLCLAMRLSFWLTQGRLFLVLESFKGMNLFVREVRVEWRYEGLDKNFLQRTCLIRNVDLNIFNVEPWICSVKNKCKYCKHFCQFIHTYTPNITTVWWLIIEIEQRAKIHKGLFKWLGHLKISSRTSFFQTAVQKRVKYSF